MGAGREARRPSITPYRNRTAPRDTATGHERWRGMPFAGVMAVGRGGAGKWRTGVERRIPSRASHRADNTYAKFAGVMAVGRDVPIAPLG